MYFDDYSTSFQSLYKPMYNLQTSYSAAMNPYAGGYGFDAGYGAGMGMYPGMGMFMNPLAGVGVGQFGGDYLVRNDEQKNNYYARPIATHKKKDDVPAMLGIIGTALGTAAVLLALKKGKRITTPAAVTPAATTAAATGTTVAGTRVITDPSRLLSRTATPSRTGVPSGVKIVSTPVTGTTAAGTGVITDPSRLLSRTATPNGTGALVKNVNTADLKPIEYYYGQNGNVFKLPAAQDVKGLLPAGSTVSNFLPAHTPTKMELAQAKLAAAQNLPSSGNVYTGTDRNMLKKVNENLFTTNPELVSKGEVVYTTHTPSTFAKEHSIGATAKGADKLAELLAKMQQA